ARGAHVRPYRPPRRVAAPAAGAVRMHARGRGRVSLLDRDHGRGDHLPVPVPRRRARRGGYSVSSTSWRTDTVHLVAHFYLPGEGHSACSAAVSRTKTDPRRRASSNCPECASAARGLPWASASAAHWPGCSEAGLRGAFAHATY